MLTMFLTSAFAAVFWLIAAAWYLLCVVGNWRIFTKFGVEGWKSVIPFYNSYVELGFTWNTTMGMVYVVLNILAVCGQNANSDNTGGFILLLLGAASLAFTVVRAIACLKLSRSFGHGGGFAVGLFFLAPLFRILLGMGPEQYLGNSSY